jgi:hypothetical protein
MNALPRQETRAWNVTVHTLLAGEFFLQLLAMHTHTAETGI